MALAYKGRTQVMMDASEARKLSYRCVVGHDISPGKLDRLTVVTNLDEGAEVRICREHGAPIALRSSPLEPSTEKH